MMLYGKMPYGEPTSLDTRPRSATMRCWVEGVQVASDLLTVRDLGFGNVLEPSCSKRSRIEMSAIEFDEIFRPIYDAFVSETKADTSRGLTPQPAALDLIGYPRVPQLRIKHQEVLRELLLGHLDFDFCHGLVQANSDESLWKYVINSLQGVILTEQDVAVELELFEMR